MTGSILPRINVNYLNKILFDQEEFLNILPYKEYSKIPTEHLQVWSVLNGIYTFPTIELIDFLKEKIADRSAIEICAGNGSIGRALDITSTDSYVQHTPEIKAYYKALGQSPTMPGCDVEKFEALEAIQKFNPKVVVGGYVTQKYNGDGNGSMYGVDEEEMLKKIDCYIHIGNDKIHGDKRIRKNKHKVVRAEWIVTRSGEPEKNCIYIFEN